MCFLSVDKLLKCTLGKKCQTEYLWTLATLKSIKFSDHMQLWLSEFTVLQTPLWLKLNHAGQLTLRARVAQPCQRVSHLYIYIFPIYKLIFVATMFQSESTVCPHLVHSVDTLGLSHHIVLGTSQHGGS